MISSLAMKPPSGVPAPDRFAHDDAVRNDVIVLYTEEFSCPVEALLYFFTDEEHAVVFAPLVQLFDEERMCRQYAAVALKRLYDDSRDLSC